MLCWEPAGISGALCNKEAALAPEYRLPRVVPAL